MHAFLVVASWVVVPVMLLALAVAIGLFFWVMLWGIRDHLHR